VEMKAKMIDLIPSEMMIPAVSTICLLDQLKIERDMKYKVS
jgi:hypothetical protein